MFVFENLDDETRQFMLQEFKFDQGNRTLYIHPRLNPEKEAKYFVLLEEALRSGSPETFSAAMEVKNILKKVELRTLHGRQSVVRIPVTAVQLLAEAEFNRYYMRAICIRAKQEGKTEVEVYRAKQVNLARSGSTALIDTRINAADLLADLRQSNLDVESKSGLGRPGSGLSIRLIQE